VPGNVFHIRRVPIKDHSYLQCTYESPLARCRLPPNLSRLGGLRRLGSAPPTNSHASQPLRNSPGITQRCIGTDSLEVASVNPSVVGQASACQSERSSDSFLPSARPVRGAAFQAAMPPFLGAFVAGFPPHSTTDLVRRIPPLSPSF
jgi:hypothetical protein